ncbi:unnamed protein product, partial [Cochlearia groenlandica]
AIGKNNRLLSGPDLPRAEAQIKNLKRAEAYLTKSKESFGKPNALALAGPLGFSSEPTIKKSWYEETEAEEEELKKEKGREVTIPTGSGIFVGTRKDSSLQPLAIDEIISPLKGMIDVPVTGEEATSSEKKKKGFTAALQARKKIVNKVARNGKMIKASRLTLRDFASVAKPRPSKTGPDPGDILETTKALVGEGPPVKG